MTRLNLAYDLTLKDLYQRQGLEKLDQLFISTLSVDFSSKLSLLRAHPQALSEVECANFLIALAIELERFLYRLFNIADSGEQHPNNAKAFKELYQFKRSFIEKTALKKYPLAQAENMHGEVFAKSLNLFLNIRDDNHFPNIVRDLIDAGDEQTLDKAMRFACWACGSEAGKRLYKNSFLFRVPQRMDDQHPFQVESRHENNSNTHRANTLDLIERDGFAYSNHGLTREQTLDQANYCIKCHPQNKDSCSKGFANAPDKKGCPLNVKISEMNVLYQSGHVTGALAIIMVNNPMVAATGDRICNDCAKACIFQKQTAVDIPSIESMIFKTVIHMPWGYELYSLLTRWNPLNLSLPLPKESSGKTILIAGMGPAGFTLSHALIQEGHQVIAIDALKINPLEQDLQELIPIKHVNHYFEDLSDRMPAGFGGVTEYGITVRWDKNYLKVIRSILERNEVFHLFDSVRLGSQITAQQAFVNGIDHIAICTGAGQPVIPDIKNLFIKGVRFAADFLMTLQLQQAHKRLNATNLLVRLPAVVIGGGLTAVDTATEVQAYYLAQVENFFVTYHELIKRIGQDKVEDLWTAEEKIIAEEFLTHGAAVIAERDLATEESRNPNFHPLLQAWGGITILYRQEMSASPSFRLNAAELFKAFQEGIAFIDNEVPYEMIHDAYGHVEGIKTQNNDVYNVIPAKSVFIATGTRHNQEILRDALGIDHLDLEGPFVKLGSIPGSISIHGDMHEQYAGSVVKAMASARNAAPLISQRLQSIPARKSDSRDIHKFFQEGFLSHVLEISQLGEKTYEIIVHAPFAAANTKPGQFFRVQNYALNLLSEATEGIALTAAKVEPEQGTISLIVLISGASSLLLKSIKKGSRISLMGPTGKSTQIPSNKNIILVGGGLGNAVLFSIAEELKNNGCKIIYFAAFKTPDHVFKKEEIEKHADQVIWCFESPDSIFSKRPEDLVITGRVTDVLKNFAHHQHLSAFKFEDTDQMMTIGPDRMMAAVQYLLQTEMYSVLKGSFVHIVSVNSPMQCMMKEVCGQCVQRQVDLNTGEEKYIFTCVNQDQDAKRVDFKNLESRLQQNYLLEKISYQYFSQAPNSKN